MPKNSKNSLPAKEKTAQIGQMVKSIYESGYLDKNTTYKMSFVKGALAGFGGVLGATVGIALLLWVLSFFDQTPFIGPLFENIERTIESKKPE